MSYPPHYDPSMSDTRISYDELLKANKMLEEELKHLRSIYERNSDIKDPGTGFSTPANILREIIENSSSYFALFKITTDNRILILDLNEKAASVESVSIADASNKYLDEVFFPHRERLVSLIHDTGGSGVARKLAVSEDNSDSLGHYIGFNLAYGNILVTWEPDGNQKNEDLAGQNLLFEYFAEMFPEMIYELDVSGKVIYANDQALKFFGFSREDIAAGIHLSKVFPNNFPRIMENLNNLNAPDQIYNEYNITMKDGSLVPIMAHSFALFHDKKKTGYRGIIFDISKQKNHEAKINREKNILKHLVDSIPEAIVLIDRDGIISNMNKEFTSMFGYAREEIIGKTVDELITPDYLRNESYDLELVREKGRIVKNTVRRDKEGNLINVSLTVVNLTTNDETAAYMGIYRNITQERKTQIIQEIVYNISAAALNQTEIKDIYPCLLYTSDAADDLLCVDLGGRRIIKKKIKHSIIILQHK